ncbi:hypothetical protein M8542_03295 [Amycolatopsis sp. OK19-0408]|uniref:Uncharacterized protein n=1 Tax=Amycolatopsis iheyensis TaxID=2945988 RepID=A0A9X2N7V5_9PSEU|nr:hypothetical protein [Amycolatopsis iheyensis]MCR6481834.1 hypothetical protein [Amycolatopsis iheyensis]
MLDLLPGEQLRWSGAPARPKLTYGEWSLVIWGTVFELIGLPIALTPASPGWTIIFPMVGLLWFTTLVVTRLVRRSTSYRVTSRRLLVARTWPWRRERAHYLGALGRPLLVPGPRHLDTIVFSEVAAMIHRRRERFRWALHARVLTRFVPCLELLPDAERVAGLIADSRARQTTRTCSIPLPP